jgi:hypothetical protein
MLILFTIIIMAAVAYAYLGEGLITGSLMCFNILLAGLIAFNFFEPLADMIERWTAGSDFADYVDALCLVVLFCLALGLLRLLTNSLQPLQIDVQGVVQSIGGAAFGLVAGYLVSGFLVCVLQTLPLHENFMGFTPTYEPASGVRDFLPPDRVWLGLMQYAGDHGFAAPEPPRRIRPPLPKDLANDSIDHSATFDKYGTFELRYARYRRYGDKREKLPYDHAFDGELEHGR